MVFFQIKLQLIIVIRHQPKVQLGKPYLAWATYFLIMLGPASLFYIHQALNSSCIQNITYPNLKN